MQPLKETWEKVAGTTKCIGYVGALCGSFLLAVASRVVPESKLSRAMEAPFFKLMGLH